MFLLYSPLNQGLKRRCYPPKVHNRHWFLLYSPLNQGLKQYKVFTTLRKLKVFTLQSIKSRIETDLKICVHFIPPLFLLYSPLNQGLKRRCYPPKVHNRHWFLLYSPLNQGLKL